MNVYRRNPQVQIRNIKNAFPFVTPKPFDLAVVQLDKNFKKFNPRVKPIILPPQGFFPNGEFDDFLPTGFASSLVAKLTLIINLKHNFLLALRHDQIAALKPLQSY